MERYSNAAALKRRYNNDDDGSIHHLKQRRRDGGVDDGSAGAAAAANAEHLKEIAENTRPKSSVILTITGSGSSIVTTYDQPIKLNPKRQYELALLNLETYYSFPNIDKTNNRLNYRKDENSNWKTVEIPVGCYEIKAINATIVQQVKSRDIQVTADVNTQQCVLHIKGTFEVDFNILNSLRVSLGFDAKQYKKGKHKSENLVNILRVNSVLVHTDIITGSYLQGKIEPVIYSFFPDVLPGEKIMQIQENLVYAHVTTDTIYRMTTWLTDQDNNKIDLRGETLTIRFHMREC